jgi:arylsulfatase A-like enzyme
MNAICLAIDRLHVGYLGAFGNTWIQTPALDRLASESVVFDQFHLDSPRLESLCRSCWQGLHALAPGESAGGPATLAKLLEGSGIHTALVTDDPQVAYHPLARDFEELVEFGLPGATSPAEDVEDTYLAEAFAQLVDHLEKRRKPFFSWCHLQVMGGPWDAPLSLRERYREEGDPEPLGTAAAPCRMLEKNFDPDELLAISQAYAGQVGVLDVCLGALVEFLQGSSLAKDTLVVLLSARGFPLGEHRRVGPCDEALYAELVHVPLLIRFPDGLGAAARSQALVQPSDLYATILDCWGLAPPAGAMAALSLLPLARYESFFLRDRLAIAGGAETAIRTPAWYLRDAEPPELFAKPDDFWEVNSVAERYPELVASLREALAALRQSLQSGRRPELPPLEEILLTGIE